MMILWNAKACHGQRLGGLYTTKSLREYILREKTDKNIDRTQLANCSQKPEWSFTNFLELVPSLSNKCTATFDSQQSVHPLMLSLMLYLVRNNLFTSRNCLFMFQYIGISIRKTIIRQITQCFHFSRSTFLWAIKAVCNLDILPQAPLGNFLYSNFIEQVSTLVLKLCSKFDIMQYQVPLKEGLFSFVYVVVFFFFSCSTPGNSVPERSTPA